MPGQQGDMQSFQLLTVTYESDVEQRFGKG